MLLLAQKDNTWWKWLCNCSTAFKVAVEMLNQRVKRCWNPQENLILVRTIFLLRNSNRWFDVHPCFRDKLSFIAPAHYTIMFLLWAATDWFGFKRTHLPCSASAAPGGKSENWTGKGNHLDIFIQTNKLTNCFKISVLIFQLKCSDIPAYTALVSSDSRTTEVTTVHAISLFCCKVDLLVKKTPKSSIHSLES